MISKSDIESMRNFNLPMLKEALRQTELRVNYTIDTKKRMDTKASILFSIFLSFATVFTTLINSSFFDKHSHKHYIISFFCLSSCAFVIGSIYLFRVLLSHSSATIGRHPETWLYDKNKIAGKYTSIQQSDNEGYIITHILLDYQNRIIMGDSSNDKKVFLIDKAIKFRMIPPVVLLLSSLVLLINQLNPF